MAETQEPVWSISEVNAAVKDLVENSFLPFWIHGEVGTLNVYSSGHVYLTLKDTKSQLRGTWFSGAAKAKALGLEIGMQIEARGRLGVYSQRGEYQFIIQELRPVGVGDLQREFEKIKRKLEAEGLFAASHKRPLPLLPHHIGVISSPDGAAVHDFMQIALRRFPNLSIRLYPAAVQGKGADRQLIAGLEFFNRDNWADVIVLTRGGGSMEDLWNFNSEALARAIAASRVPVVSAVGHEIDFTIADFAADLRAPTPSAAAELAVPLKTELDDRIDRSVHDLAELLTLRLGQLEARLQLVEKSYAFREPVHLLDRYRTRVEEAARMAAQTARERIMESEHRLESARGRLTALDPGAVLKRGYAILTRRDTDSVIDSIAKGAPGMKLTARLADGTIDLTQNS